MNRDAEERIRGLADSPPTPTTQADRIRAMRAHIDAAREKGHTWLQICEAIGVSRSSLHSALGRGSRSSRTSSAAAAVGTSTTSTPNQQLRRKPERWKRNESS